MVTVFLAAPVMRTVARMELPSTRQPTMRARCSVLNLFILTIMLDCRQTRNASTHYRAAGRQGTVAAGPRDADANMPNLPMGWGGVCDVVEMTQAPSVSRGPDGNN